MKKSLSVFFSFFLCFLHAEVSLENLKTNYLNTPPRTDLPTPQSSWQMTAPTSSHGVAQKAFRILVKNEKNLKVWDSGKVNSAQAHAIQYAGEALKPSTRYTWALQVWDNKGKLIKSSSWFETGLLDP